MTSLVEYSFGNDSDVIKYIRKWIRNSNYYLSTLITRMNLENGIVKTYLAEGTDYSKAIDFHGHIVGVYDGQDFIEGSRYLVSQLIHRYLQHNNNCLVSENWYDQLSDPHFEEYNKEYLFYRDELYYVVSGRKDKPIRDIEQAFAVINPFQGLLTSFPEDNSIERGEQVDAEWMQKLVSNVRALIVEVYDGSGYLIWTRDGNLNHL